MARALKDDAPSLPARVKLTRPHGFIDENGTHRFWHAGDHVSDPATIELLIDRAAPVQFLD
jgi:hypothetical protein